jgi:hypothetical protein
MQHKGYIAVDLDGTLAEYHGWVSAEHIGAPVPRMLQRVKDWLDEGLDVRIFTARVYCNPVTCEGIQEATVAREAIHRWCEYYLGRRLPVTCMKDYGMVELWDDRAVQVEANTGRRMDEATLPQAA